MRQVTFLGEVCNVVFREYQDGRTRIDLVMQDCTPMATCTVNIPQYVLPKDHVAIKDYSENAGMMNVLIEAGIIGEPITAVRSGFVTIPICPLLVKE